MCHDEQSLKKMQNLTDLVLTKGLIPYVGDVGSKLTLNDVNRRKESFVPEMKYKPTTTSITDA